LKINYIPTPVHKSVIIKMMLARDPRAPGAVRMIISATNPSVELM